MKVILVIDIGSSSIRCSPYSVSGMEVSPVDRFGISYATSKQRKSVIPNSGKINCDGLLDEINNCIESVIEKMHRQKIVFWVVAIGFSSFVMNLIAVDKSGNIIGEEATISYACNSTQIAKECQEIKTILGSEGLENLHQRTGAPIHSSYAIPQLRALYKSSPEITSRIYKWTSIASLCIARWHGEVHWPISYSEASWTGLLNFRECIYEQAALNLLPKECIDALPELDFKTGSSERKRKRPSCFDNPEFDGVKFYRGFGDGACANIGSKAVSTSRIAVTIGTSAAARICIPLEIGSNVSMQVPKGLFCYRIDEHNVLVGGALTDGGSVIEWAKEFLNLTEEGFQKCMEEVEALSSEREGSNLTMIPFLSGERSTGYRAGATGAVIGLTRATTPAHFMNACLESVALRLRSVLEKIIEGRGTFSSLPQIVASGKALESNDVWRQMIADSSGLTIILDPQTYEGTSRGVAKLLAATIISGWKGRPTSEFLVEEDITTTNIKKPRPHRKAYFDKAAQNQEEFTSAVSPIYMRHEA